MLLQLSLGKDFVYAQLLGSRNETESETSTGGPLGGGGGDDDGGGGVLQV